ncbi:hypothetical protein D3C85_1724610 [compost metagenome]
MEFATYSESRLDAIKAAASTLNISIEEATKYVDDLVAKLRRECEAAGVPNKTAYIRGEHYKFKIDTTFLTFD